MFATDDQRESRLMTSLRSHLLRRALSWHDAGWDGYASNRTHTRGRPVQVVSECATEPCERLLEERSDCSLLAAMRAAFARTTESE